MLFSKSYCLLNIMLTTLLVGFGYRIKALPRVLQRLKVIQLVNYLTNNSDQKHHSGYKRARIGETKKGMS